MDYQNPKPSCSTKKRNVWTSAEVQFFLSLVKEKKVLGLMDGKRLRVTDIFKTLLEPLKEHGFIRDSSQLIVKYKNLKAEYYKCKRNNSISGSSRMSFEFFDEMDELLGDRPISQSQDGGYGFESIEFSQDTTKDLTNFEVVPDVEFIEVSSPSESDIPDSNNTPSTSKCVLNTNLESEQKKKGSSSKKIVKEDPLVTYLKTLEETRKHEKEQDKQMLNEFFENQERLMLTCTDRFMKGLQDIFHKSNNSSDT